MTVYNIREKFSYVIATSSIEYIRNYNFNTSTVSDIPITMTNSDETTPITVNINTTEPWMQIVDPISGKSVKMPDGNIVLEPTGSAIVLLKIDLPPEIESRTETVIRPNVIFDIKSGSFPIVLPSNTTGSSQADTSQSIEQRKNSIVTTQEEYVLDIGEKITVNLTVYDKNGNPDTKSKVMWRVTGTKVPPKDIEEIKRAENVSLDSSRKVVKINSPYNSQTKKSTYYPRTVEGVFAGTVYVLLTATEDKPKKAKQVGKRKLLKFTVTNRLFRETPDSTPTVLTTQVTGSAPTNMQTNTTGSFTPPQPPQDQSDDLEVDGSIL